MRYLLMKVRNIPQDPPLAAGYYMSEKFDGIRCLWDGGVSRGDLKSNVPWANTEKDGRYVKEQVATGLWSQYGHVFHAPDWFLDELPNAVIEGELFAGRGNWQTLSSIVKTQTPDECAWDEVDFIPFDMPVVDLMFANGKVRYGAKYNHIIRGGIQYFTDRADPGIRFAKADWPYSTRRSVRNKLCMNLPPLREDLVYNNWQCAAPFEQIVSAGGEGLVLKSQENRWTTDRAKDVFKMKPVNDGEAIVVDWVEGKGKYKGMLGALVCETIGDDNGLPNGVKFELSGMTDAERRLTFSGSEPLVFKTGDVITFKYRELSDTGVPKEPRYMRNR